MKKIMTEIRALGAIVLVAAALGSCSREEPVSADRLSGKNVYTLTVNAGKSAVTRALSLEGSTLNAEWAKGEEVTVQDASGAVVGTLTAQDSGITTVLSGDLTVTPAVGDQFELVFTSGAYNDHDGTLTGTDKSIDKLCDSASATVTVTEVEGTKVSATDATFKNEQSIVKFTFGAGSNKMSPTALAVRFGSYDINLADIPEATYTTNGEGVVFVAIPSCGQAGQDVFISATAGGENYFYKTSGVTFVDGKYYDISVAMTKGILLDLVKGDVTAKDGYVITGTLNGEEQPYKVSVADGADVVLRNATIIGEPSNWSEDRIYEWAGLTCEGDATVTLEGDNSVTGFDARYPGMIVAEGSTLTINGDGSLDVKSNGDAAGIGSAKNDLGNCGNIVIDGDPTIIAIGGKYAAGIGACTRSNNGTGPNSCGDITIKGGTVTAVGGHGAAGIGTSFGCGSSHLSVCGNITISGGTITATGGFLAAAIGGGGGYNAETETDTKDLRAYYTVGDVTITDGVTKVTATKGEGKITEGGFGYAPMTIGRGLNYQGTYETSPRFSVGTVTVGGVMGDISESPYTFPE